MDVRYMVWVYTWRLNQGWVELLLEYIISCNFSNLNNTVYTWYGIYCKWKGGVPAKGSKGGNVKPQSGAQCEPKRATSNG